ncbi:MAG: ABC transporter permease [Candidatus Limiplasma sp.]|nr:ABC transporter permease [Candidatus Limiplasma sp.]
MLDRLFRKNVNTYRIYRKLIRNKPVVFGAVIILLVVLTALLYPLITPYPYDQADFMAAFQAPSAKHIMGTDELGRDLFSRILYGCQITITVGVVAVLIAMVAGVTLGLLAGYFRGKVDTVITAILDAVWAFPTLILALAITAILGPGLRNVLIAIGIVYTPGFARVVRSMVLSVREMEYVQGARAIGLGNFKIIYRYVLPNISSVIIVQASLNAAQAIIAEASLSFLGLGVQAPAASWGSLLKTGYQYIYNAPWLSIFPGLCIFLTVLALNFLGDGLRDALDVKIKAD